MKRKLPIAALATIALSASLLAPTAASAKPSITMSGSTSVAPLAELLAKKYIASCGHCANFKLLQGGSDIGVADVAAGRVTIGMSSRDPKPSDPGGLVFYKVARDAVCIVSNNANKIPSIDTAGIQAIFGGGVRSWTQVPGSTQKGPIEIFVRSPGSGTQDAFQRIFMGSQKVFGGAEEKNSNGRVQAAVSSNPLAVGYVSLYFTSGTHTIPYKGVPCTLRNAKSGQYGGSRNFYMVTRGAAKGAAKQWIKWITRSGAARSVIGTEWVPLR
ncbi:MAG TPA: substrate-binding domain-containing protein [Solirubrobacterales bacterium]